MSTVQHPEKASENDAPVEIDLGRRRRWLVPAIVAVVVLVAAVVTVALVSNGSSRQAVEGSHFGNDLQVAYEADSGSERAFLEYQAEQVQALTELLRHLSDEEREDLVRLLDKLQGASAPGC